MHPYVASHLKDMNRKTVYRLLVSEKNLSKAEIVRRTGISMPTVLKIVNRFIESGIVTELGEGESELGRKPLLLQLNPQAAFSIGVEFDVNFLKIGVVDLLGELIYAKKVECSLDFERLLKERLADEIEVVIEESKVEREKILGVGISVPAVVDVEKQVLQTATILGITEPLPCKKLLQGISRQLDLDVVFENDVNAAVYAEKVVRKMDTNDDLVFLSLASGYGAGIILDGKLRRGAHNFAGEVGYMAFDRKYKVSNHESGWLERELSKNISGLSEAGVEAAAIFEKVAENIALSIANIHAVLDVNLFVLGGSGIAQLGDNFIKRVNELLKEYCLFQIKCEAPCSKEPMLVGVAAIALENNFNRWLD